MPDLIHDAEMFPGAGIGPGALARVALLMREIHAYLAAPDAGPEVLAGRVEYVQTAIYDTIRHPERLEHATAIMHGLAEGAMGLQPGQLAALRQAPPPAGLPAEIWECPECHCLFDQAGIDHEPCRSAAEPEPAAEPAALEELAGSEPEPAPGS